MENKKKYVKPEAEVIEFSDTDIIVTSGENPWGTIGGVDDTQVPQN